MSDQADNKNQKLIASFIVILAVVLVAVGVSMFAKKTNTPTTTTQKPVTPNTPGVTAPSSAPYKDGMYNAESSYTSPGGKENISVSVTLKGGIVTDASVKQNADNRESAEYQDAFMNGFSSQVVGKALDSISLSHVSGSSLTSQGFNNALEQIKSQAHTV